MVNRAAIFLWFAVWTAGGFVTALHLRLEGHGLLPIVVVLLLTAGGRLPLRVCFFLSYLVPRVRRRRLAFLRAWEAFMPRDEWRDWWEPYAEYRRALRRNPGLRPQDWVFDKYVEADAPSRLAERAVEAAAPAPALDRRVTLPGGGVATLHLHTMSKRRFGVAHTWSWDLDDDVDATPEVDEAIAAAIRSAELAMGLPLSALRPARLVADAGS